LASNSNEDTTSTLTRRGGVGSVPEKRTKYFDQLIWNNEKKKKAVLKSVGSEKGY
jgi:hypothetical protein